MKDETLMGKPMEVSGELELTMDGTLDWVGHIIPESIIQGSYEICHTRSWRQRLLSWPWKPWCNVEGHAFQGRIKSVEDGGHTLNLELEIPIKKTLKREKVKRWLIR